MKRMVKELLVVLVAVAMIICLSGCARVNYEVNVNKDGSADVSYVMGIEKETLNSMGYSEESFGVDFFADMKDKVTEDGYQAEDYSDDELIGIKASKHFENISDFKLDNIAGTDITESDVSNEIFFKNVFLDKKISQNAKIDLSSKSEDKNSENDNMSTLLLGNTKFSYKVSLPFKAGDNNATTVSEDGKTLEWTLTPGEVNEIHFEAGENLNVILLACVVAAVVIVVVVLIVIGTKGKNKSNKKEVKVTPKKTVNTNNKTEVKKEVETKKEDTKPVETKKAKATEKEDKLVDEKEDKKEE